MKLVNALMLAACAAVMVLASGCSTPCGPANCTGCCDTHGLCQVGTTTNACGSSGGSCVSCQAFQSCSLGLCQTTTQTCNASNCATGCCNGNTCQSACSAGQTCNSNHQCVSGGNDGGSCGPGNCAGCCSGGTCIALGSETSSQCGSGGLACANCTTTGGTCSAAGACQGGSCTSTNCANGCCVGTACITAETSQQCGTGGGVCQSCSGSTPVCSGGACIAQTGCTCPNGCCDINGTCHSPESNAFCGTFGGTCSSCSGTCNATTGQCSSGGGCTNCSTGCCSGTTCVLPSNQTSAQCGTGGNACVSCGTQACTNGTCGGTTATVGQTCTSNADCASLGAGAVCRLTTPNGGEPYPGGFCTLPCTSTCPTGSTCTNLGGLSSIGINWESGSLCLPNCTSVAQCRNGIGYNCFNFSGAGATTFQCWIDPPAPAGFSGKACNSTSNPCGFPPLLGGCIDQVQSDGGMSGFPGGYCIADCTAGGATYCGSGGDCVQFNNGMGGTVGQCWEACSGPLGGQSNCRTGYVCTNDGAGGGFCDPSCNNSGITCPGGFVCNTGTGYCCDGGTCF